ncbi:MAG: hypothetical protein ACPGU3_10055 [Litorivicinus sp.]
MNCTCSRRQLLALGALSLALPRTSIAQGLELLTGQATTTGKRALSISVTANDTLLTLGHDSMLAQAGAELEVTPGGGGIEQLVIKAGRVLSVFKPESGLREVVLPNAVAAVRGTAVYAHHDHGEEYLCCCYGEVELSVTDAPGSLILQQQYHRAHVFKAGLAPIPAPYQAPAFHFDDELMLLEATQNRQPHWKLPDGQMLFKRPGPLPKTRG